eukprot:7359042-Prymnesium_polylepis.1
MRSRRTPLIRGPESTTKYFIANVREWTVVLLFGLSERDASKTERRLVAFDDVACTGWEDDTHTRMPADSAPPPG